MSTTYTPANRKPNKLLTGFISVRVPELKYIYEDIHEATDESEVVSKFGRPGSNGLNTDNVEDSLRFLNVVDLIESPTRDVLDTIDRINGQLFRDLPFEARLLYHCNQQGGRQEHFTDIHRALFSEEGRIVDAGRDNLRTILKRETDYGLSWTEEKFNMWMNISEQLGLVTEIEDGLVLSPCRALLHDALTLAPTEPDDSPSYSDDTVVEDGEARHILDWVQENLFTVYESRGASPKIHPAVADVLRNMTKDGVVELSAPGDSRNEVKLPPENLNEDNRGNRQNVTYISINSAPNETAYQYPLDQFLTNQ